MFALIGIIGASSAPWAGKVIDRSGNASLFVPALVIVSFAFALLFFFGNSVWGLISAIVFLDFGIQIAQVSNQANIYKLPADVHSRVNAVYMITYFLGGTVGSALGTLAWTYWKWPGVCLSGISFAIIAMLLNWCRCSQSR